MNQRQKKPHSPRLRGLFAEKGREKFSQNPKKSCFRHAKQLDGIFRKAYNDEVIGQKGEYPHPLPRFAEGPRAIPEQFGRYSNQGVEDL